MANQNTTGLIRIINAGYFSIAGLKAAWQHEAAFRQELGLLIIAIPNALWLGKTTIEVLLLIGSIILIIIVELLNSAIETVVDRVGLEHHQLSGRAKDIASAAVMLTVVWAIITWLLILI
jgi:diacylglycerol kinase (ATP)